MRISDWSSDVCSSDLKGDFTMTPWRAVREEIEKKNTTYVLAISGGVDSMVLLDFFTRSKTDFVVAHFNHNLQPINVDMERSEERRVGKEGVSTCRTGWSR